MGPLQWIVAWIAIATVAGMGYRVLRLSDEPLLGMSERGTRVGLVRPGGPADRAGLEEGDIIVEIAGRPMEHHPDPSRFLRDQGVGPISIVYERRGVLTPTTLNATALEESEVGWQLARAVVAAIILSIGTFVFTRRMRGLTLVFFGICLSLSILLFHPKLPAETWGYYVSATQVALLSTLLPALLLHFFLLFPYPRIRLSQRVWILLLIYLPCPVFFVLVKAQVFGLDRLFGLDPATLRTIGENGTSLYWSTALVLSVFLFYRSFRKSPLPTVRRKLKVAFAGTVLGLVPLLLVLLAHLAWPAVDVPGDRLAALMMIFLPASFGYAIVRHGIFDIEFIVKRSLLYSAMTSALILLYFLVFFALRAALQGFTGQGQHIGTILAVVFVAVIMSPIRTRIQEGLDRWIDADRYEVRRPMRDLAAELQKATEPGEVERVVLRTLENLLGVQRAAFFRAGSGGEHFHVTETLGIGAGARGGNGLGFGRHLAEPLFRLGEPVLRGDLEAELPYGFLPERDLETMRLLKARVLVPLPSPRRRLGVLILGPRSYSESYSAPEMEVLEGLQSQIALALEKAMFQEESRGHEDLQREMELAHSLQQQLLPRSLPKLPSLDLAAANLPCHEVGGDYYDCQVVNGREGSGELVLAIGDVSGKGVPAALLMANVQATFRTEAQAGRSPEEILRIVNQQLCAIERPDRFVSLFCARLDLRTRELRYANGGHLPPILVRSGGAVDRLAQGGLLLGIREPVEYDAGAVPLSPGDLLLLFTDGVIERGGAEAPFGESALQALAAKKRHLGAEDLLGRVLEELERTSGVRDADDTTLLVVKVL